MFIANDPEYVLVRQRLKETKPVNLSCETIRTQSAGRFTQSPAKHEAECFPQPNYDVIQNGAEKVNH